MITFHLPFSSVERLAFAYSPVLEAVLSLHVLIEPKHHAIQHPWVRQMQRLSPTLKREIDTFSLAYRSSFPGFLFPVATGPFATFESEMVRLHNLEPHVLHSEFTQAFSCNLLGSNHIPLDTSTIYDVLLQQVTNLDSGRLQLVHLALEEPMLLQERFMRLLSAYWDAAFQQEWQRIEEQLATSVAESGQQIALHGLYAFLQGLWPEIRTDVVTERFWLERPHNHEIIIGPEENVVLVPSIYAWPHIRVNCDPPWTPSLTFPIAGIARTVSPPLPPAEMLRVLRALSDDTRLQALRLIAERPRSTQELAPLVGLSEAALSKHLRLLADAGVLQTQRMGYYVLYHLVPEQVTTVMSSVQNYLENTSSH